MKAEMSASSLGYSIYLTILQASSHKRRIYQTFPEIQIYCIHSHNTNNKESWLVRCDILKPVWNPIDHCS